MKLTLTRPLCGFDTETTGINVQKDRIIEIGVTKIGTEGVWESRRWLINPGISIPEEASAVHGITDEMVKDSPTFEQAAPEIFAYMDDCDVAGFNSSNFDIPFLFIEFERAGIYWNYRKFHAIDVRNIYVQREERTLSAAHLFYLGTPLEDAHSASADTEATMRILVAQLEKYEDLPNTIEELAFYSNYGKKIVDIAGKFTFNEKDEVIFNFGPHKDKPVSSEPGFLNWMLSKDFTADTKKIARHLLEKSKQK